MSIDRTAMVYLLDELEERALVERVRHPQDRRAFLIHMTIGGQDLQRRAASALAGAAQTLLEPLEPAERQHLVDLLATIAAHWQQLTAGQQHPATSHARPAAVLDEPPARPRTPRRTPPSRPARNP